MVYWKPLNLNYFHFFELLIVCYLKILNYFSCFPDHQILKFLQCLHLPFHLNLTLQYYSYYRCCLIFFLLKQLYLNFYSLYFHFQNYQKRLIYYCCLYLLIYSVQQNFHSYLLTYSYHQYCLYLCLLYYLHFQSYQQHYYQQSVNQQLLNFHLL